MLKELAINEPKSGQTFIMNKNSQCDDLGAGW